MSAVPPAPAGAPPSAQRSKGYARWSGARTAQGLRWWVIARGNLSLALANRWVKVVLVASLAPGIIASGIIYFLLPLSAPILHTVLLFSIPFTFLVGALVGARMVSEDRRQGAFLAHFSRPVTRLDYLLGKFVALVVPLLFVTSVGGLFAIAADAGVDSETLADRLAQQGAAPGREVDPLGYLVHVEPPGSILAVVAFSVIASVTTAGIVLGLSALTTRARLAGIAWFAIVAFGFAAHNMLQEVLSKDWPAFLSWWDALSDIAAGLLGLPEDAGAGISLEYHYLARAALLLAASLVGLAIVHEQLRRAEGGMR